CPPSTAKRFHERHGGDELLAAQGGGGKFDVQGGTLSGCHFEIGDEAIAVLIVDDIELFAGGEQGIIFGSVLVGEKRLGGKVVFDFGERRQDVLAIGGNHFFVSRLCQPQTCAKFSSFKDGQGYGLSYCPRHTRPID